MKKLGLLLFLFVCAAVVRAQSNIVKSLERNVPGQGKVTIHQDSRIELCWELPALAQESRLL